MISIDQNKLSFRDCKSVALSDGSVRLVRYAKPAEKQLELLELKKGYYSTTEYTLRVNIPSTPKLAVIAFVSHTSQNSWRVMYGSANHAGMQTVSTLGEVQLLLAKIFPV